MAFFFKKFINLLFLIILSVPICFGYIAFQNYQSTIAKNPQRTANIADIIDLKIGDGTYLVEYPSLGGTGYETKEAKTVLFFGVFEIGESVTISIQLEKTLIINQRNYLFWGGIGLIYVSLWLFLLLSLLSMKVNNRKGIIAKLSLGFAITGLAILLFSVAHYGWKEKTVYLNYSHQVTGELTDYHRKMCGGRKRKRRSSTKKYPCFTRIVTYSPLGSFEAFTVKGTSYSRNKVWEIGTPFEVVYLKSNDASARILDTVESNTWVYVLLFFGVFCLTGAGYFFWNAFSGKNVLPKIKSHWYASE